MSGFETISPIDGKVVFEAGYHGAAGRNEILTAAQQAQPIWAATDLEERCSRIRQAVAYLLRQHLAIGRDLARQMGRPVRQAPAEISSGLRERAEHMLNIAEHALGPREPRKNRLILRRPLGTVAVLAPWNYPFLTAANAIIPALAAGNCVILKHSEQTPLAALAFQQAFDTAGLPDGVFQHIFLDHAGAAALVADPRVDHVAFTGSVGGGQAVLRAIGERFIGVGLELGGKDAAYVRADADLDQAIAGIADGGFFNAGQSCCGIERVYAAAPVYDRLVEGLVAQARALTLGDPLDEETTLGPMARARGADGVRDQVGAALAQGARALVGAPHDRGSPYHPPEILVDVDHDMALMRQETFGPVLAVMKVADDAEAVAAINDSDYGLTASIWTDDRETAFALGQQLMVGTVFQNRCDTLDPALAWTGVKQSGRGVSLSKLGYDQLTRPQSFNFH